MQSFDHFPFDSGTDPARLTTLHDALALVSVPPQPATLPHTYQRRYGRTYCVSCGLDAAYCRANAHASPEVASQDGAHSDLQRRIAEAQRDAGGR